jgi:hypothetical protein
MGTAILAALSSLSIPPVFPADSQTIKYSRHSALGTSSIPFTGENIRFTGFLF